MSDKAYIDQKRSIGQIETARLIAEELGDSVYSKIPEERICKFTCPECGFEVLIHISTNETFTNEHYCVDCFEKMEKEHFEEGEQEDENKDGGETFLGHNLDEEEEMWEEFGEDDLEGDWENPNPFIEVVDEFLEAVEEDAQNEGSEDIDEEENEEIETLGGLLGAVFTDLADAEIEDNDENEGEYE